MTSTSDELELKEAGGGASQASRKPPPQDREETVGIMEGTAPTKKKSLGPFHKNVQTIGIRLQQCMKCRQLSTFLPLFHPGESAGNRVGETMYKRRP